MCVAYPMQITEIVDGTHCRVLCAGVGRSVNTRLLPGCKIGDYVLVHAGYAIEKVSPADAENNLELFRRMEEILKK